MIPQFYQNQSTYGITAKQNKTKNCLQPLKCKPHEVSVCVCVYVCVCVCLCMCVCVCTYESQYPEHAVA